MLRFCIGTLMLTGQQFFIDYWQSNFIRETRAIGILNGISNIIKYLIDKE